ncbi:MAG: hypothetical protein ACKO1K_02285 [Burkholderiales bacterium]
MTAKPTKRPRDPNQLAKLMVDIASGDVEESAAETVVAQERGVKGGKVGGKARAKSLTPRQRSEIAQAAAQARWKKRD